MSSKQIMGLIYYNNRPKRIVAHRNKRTENECGLSGWINENKTCIGSNQSDDQSAN